MNSQKFPNQSSASFSPLKVVPPGGRSQPSLPLQVSSDELKTTTIAPTDPSSNPPKAGTEKASKRPRKLAMVATMMLGVMAIGYLEISNYVTADSEIESGETVRTQVNMPRSGSVQILVKTNDRVKAGDVLAKVESLDLENQIAESQKIWEQATAELAASQQKLLLAKTRLEAAQNNQAIALANAEKQRQDMQLIVTGEGLPKIRQLEREQAGIQAEISGINFEILGIQSAIAQIENEITGFESEIISLTNQLNIVANSLQKRQNLVDQGFFAEEHPEIVNFRLEKETLDSQIEQKTNQIQVYQQRILQQQSQIQQQESLIAQKHQQIQAKSEQIKEIENQQQEILDEQENELARKNAERVSAEKEVDAAVVDLQNQKQAVDKSAVEVKRLENQKESLILRAEISGTVLTSALDLKNNSWLNAGQEILQIADLHQVAAIAQVSQGDKSLVEVGQTVIYQSGSANSVKYQATVTEILPIMDFQQASANSMLPVKVLIENPEYNLLPGEKGYVHIKTKPMRIYQKVQHEFGKLVNIGKYFPWLSDQS